MHPLIQALLSPWDWRLEILVVLISSGTLYMVGWRRLRKRHVAGRGIATKPKLAAYGTGLIVLATALMSPIDFLGGQLFFMHMIQHLLTMMVAAPLLWLASPFPMILWGLPASARRTTGRLFRRQSRFRQLLATATKPLVAWLLFVAVYLGWHEPLLYNLALRRAWVHDLQHISFFLVAMLYWWHVIGAAPKIHGRYPVWVRMGYLIGTIPPNMMAGVAIAFSSVVLYTYYESVPRIWGVTVLQDQMLGGVIMWIPGSMMFLLAAIVLLSTQFGRYDQSEDGPRPQTAAPDAMDEPLTTFLPVVAPDSQLVDGTR